MTDFSIPVIVAPVSYKRDNSKKKDFVDKLKGKQLEVCPSVRVGVTFTVCNTSTQDYMQVYKTASNNWMVWGSISYDALTDVELEDVLWDMYVAAGHRAALRITDEFGCMTWKL